MYIYISWNIIKKFKFVFDAFVKVRVIEFDVYSNYKKVIVVLLPHFSHWEQQEDVWFGNRSQVWFSPAKRPCIRAPPTKLKYEKYVLIEEMQPFLCLCSKQHQMCFYGPLSVFVATQPGLFCCVVTDFFLSSPRPRSHCPFVWEANIWSMTLACLRFASWGFPPGLSSSLQPLITSTPALDDTHGTKKKKTSLTK